MSTPPESAPLVAAERGENTGRLIVGGDGAAARRYCRETLPSVSRTFALTIRVLPEPLRHPVTVAYLLCRITDVLEDATGSDPSARVARLEALAGALHHPSLSALDLSAALDGTEDLVPHDPPGRELLRHRAAVFQAFRDLPAAQREIVSRWVQAMALGMASFVAREGRSDSTGDGVRGDPGRPGATRVPYVLATEEELRSYAWYVAGTVGHLLTELFERHCGSRWPDRERMRSLCAPFGLGLQFTNILQDLSEDRRRGWSYVPEELARAYGTSVQELDDPRKVEAALHVVGHLVGEAATYLDQAMEYTLLLPRGAPRLRLFCLWPSFFAVRTLARICGERQVLAGSSRVRISRPEVRRVIAMTTALCWSDGALAKLWQGEKRRLQRRMDTAPA